MPSNLTTRWIGRIGGLWTRLKAVRHRPGRERAPTGTRALPVHRPFRLAQSNCLREELEYLTLAAQIRRAQRTIGTCRMQQSKSRGERSLGRAGSWLDSGSLETTHHWWNFSWGTRSGTGQSCTRAQSLLSFEPTGVERFDIRSSVLGLEFIEFWLRTKD